MSEELREELARWLHEQYGEHTQPHSARVDALLSGPLAPLLAAQAAVERVEALAVELRRDADVALTTSRRIWMQYAEDRLRRALDGAP